LAGGGAGLRYSLAGGVPAVSQLEDSRMKRRLIYCFLLLAGGGVCWAGMKVDAKSYAEMDLSAYSTYEWSTDQEADSGHPLSAGSPLDRRLQEIARTALAGSGLEPAVDGEPDLLIHCIAISREVQDIGGVKKDMGGGVTWVGDVGAHGVTAYRGAQEDTQTASVVEGVVPPVSANDPGWGTKVPFSVGELGV
jgi:hypothetical protein